MPSPPRRGPKRRGKAAEGPEVVLVPLADPSGSRDRYSLGTASVAAALTAEAKRRGTRVKLHYRNDLDYHLHSPDEIAEAILAPNPLVAGLGLYVWNQHVSRQVAAILKEEAPDLVVVGGGPWVSAEAERFAAENPAFDVIVSGDGEAAFAEIVFRRHAGRKIDDLAGIPGTIVRAAGDLRATPPRRADPNAYPSPYKSGFIEAPQSLRLAVRRGCGMACRYCNWAGGFSAPLSPERIAADVWWASSRNVDEIWLVDSAVNRRPDDLERLAWALERGDVHERVHTTAFIDYAYLDDERVGLLRRCRLDGAEVGLQTTTPKALELARRRFDRERFERALERLAPMGRVVVDVILGLPGDDPESFRRTIDYLKTLEVQTHLFMLLGLPGSEYYRNREQWGLEFAPEGVPHVVRSETFSSRDLEECAAYYVGEVARKASGSDFYSGNYRFDRYPYNRLVPESVYREAHERFGDPWPPRRARTAPATPNLASSGGRRRGRKIRKLITDGRFSAHEDVPRRLAEVGVELVAVKLFGANADEHDAQTGAPGSFEQALSGVRALRAAGLRVVVTFPRLGERVVQAADARNPHLELAYRLTNTLPVVFPSGETSRPLQPIRVDTPAARAETVAADHPGGWRYDAVVAVRGADSPQWGPPYLPMVHIPVGMRCNNRCLYCNVRGGEDTSVYDRPYVEALISHAAGVFLPKGPAALDLIGGEPTLHPELPALVAHARAVGFPAVTVCTNGVRLARGDALDRLVEAGVTAFRYSMHDHRPEEAARLAGRPDVGPGYLATARALLRRKDVETFFYRILLAETLDTLPGYLRWLAAENRTGRPIRVHLGLPSNRGRLFESPSLFPPLDAVRPAVARAMTIAGDLGIDLLTFHSPGCLLPDAPERSASLHLEARQIDARSGAITRLEFEGDTWKAPACAHCVAADICAGLPRRYYDDDPDAAAAWPMPLSD